VTAVAVELPAPPRTLDWQELARCTEADPELFYPAKGADAREARRFCRACDVRPECLEYALARSEGHGVWGGTTYRERLRLRGTA
jgi:WhiB family redox-sensing transcriptional regulator